MSTDTLLEDKEKCSTTTISPEDEEKSVPDRYAALASLDEEEEEEEWRERAAVVTRIEHEGYQGYARSVLVEMADSAVAIAENER